MGNVLICTVGNRDLVLSDPQQWPPELRDPEPGEKRSQPGARPRGVYLREHFSTVRRHLQLPIIEKALRLLKQDKQELDQLILIVSDQPLSTPASYRDKDTLDYGHVIKAYIGDHPYWQGLVTEDSISLETVETNPADFDEMHSFFRQCLPELRQKFGVEHTYYLALSGGTPAMTAMLLFDGSDIFGKDCVPLYISDALALPLRLDVGRRIHQQSLRAAILTAIRSFDYTTAYKLIGDDHIVDSHADQQAIRALLLYAQQRSVFDFETAQRTLFSVQHLLTGRRKAEVVALWNEMAGLSEEWKFRETCYGADIKYRTGAYFDFLSRMFRFHEGALRHLARRWGAQFSGSSGKKLDLNWVSNMPGLQAWFDNYVYKNQTGLQYTRDVSRPVLVALVEFLAPHQQGAKLVASINQIEGLADLRNSTVHDFNGISKGLLAQTFTSNQSADEPEADRIVPTLFGIYEAVFGQSAGENAFDQINHLLEEFLKEAA